MGDFRRRVNSALSAYFPEKRLFIQSGNSTRYLRLTPLSQFMSGAASLAMVGWMAVATATVAIDFVGGSGDDPRGGDPEGLPGAARGARRRARPARRRGALGADPLPDRHEADQPAADGAAAVGRAAARADHRARPDAAAAAGRGRPARRGDRRQRPAAGADERRQREAERPGRHRPRRDAEDGLGRALRGGGGARRGERGAGGADASRWPTSSSGCRSTPSARTRWSTSWSRRSPCPSGRWRS